MRGGAGRGQGRKKIVPDIFDLMIHVGQRCQDIQTTERDAKALDNYEDQHHIRVLRDAQELVCEGAIPGTADDIEKFVVSETHLKKNPRRAISLAKYRPKRKTREEVCQIVAGEIGGISWHTVNKYWKQYRTNLRKARSGASGL